MNAIRVKAHIQSETLHLPQLRRLIGKNVEIIVLEEVKAGRTAPRQRKRSGKKNDDWFARNFGRGWPGKKNDGFENAVKKWRRGDRNRELPD